MSLSGNISVKAGQSWLGKGLEEVELVEKHSGRNWSKLVKAERVEKRKKKKRRDMIRNLAGGLRQGPWGGVVNWDMWPSRWLMLGFYTCFSTFDGSAPTEQITTRSKPVYTTYSVTGIPGDGRCLFRAVAHGAALRSGKDTPCEYVQRELADDLRNKVVGELVKRRGESEWFIEGDFDTYVNRMKEPHVWGGEPELLMASHVLKMPIAVYMSQRDLNGIISIAEYGHEYYGKDSSSPIRVLYHGYGHYDALQVLDAGVLSKL